ncbi:hypothetical protein ACG2F4_12110 [Halalkalibaculum sp. DA3122]|uniref:hypothetical protein n=1 Tax=Halalkalibaculum sp. DA3122 TaxID=3373607 RepID=UPI0037544D6A
MQSVHSTAGIFPFQNTGTGITNDAGEKTRRNTTSVTAGYIEDEFNLRSDNGSYRYRFNGKSTGIMLSSRSSSAIFSYGIADAQETEGDIRSITADLNLGGNISIFRHLFGVPIGSFIPVRVNMGYRNLELMDNTEYPGHAVNIGTASLGGGLGAHIRIPTGLPVLQDNLTAFASVVTSVGGIGEFSGLTNDPMPDSGDAISGIRLTKNTDFNFEAKFERLLGGKTGVTAGLTLRWLHWTDERADNAKQLLDVISGKQQGLGLQATQSFFRIGINW